LVASSTARLPSRASSPGEVANSQARLLSTPESSGSSA
jgi:hypothetical protein